jgi:glycosyltransferase involved in cell wall biosynthesis
MSVIGSVAKAEQTRLHLSTNDDGVTGEPVRPLVSLVVPAYNESAVLERNLNTLCRYLQLLENEFRWEIVLINDGSTDETGPLAEAFARKVNNIRVLHHARNFGLGQALKTAFACCQGDFIVTMDIDLSYSPDHIHALLTQMRKSGAKITVASPYMNGGKTSNVPWLRRKLSKWANRFLALAAKGDVSTLTGMVRAYDADFLKSLNLKSVGMEINPEIVYKAMILRAQVEEVPAHLDWHLQNTEGTKRRSSMRMLRHTLAVLLSGFLFRPVMFFLVPGLALLFLAIYVNSWMFIHFFNHYESLAQYTWFPDRASNAVAAAYVQAPHTFIVGGLASMLAIQLISLGILALQSKSYFEEIFHLGTTIYKSTQVTSDKAS